MKDGSMVQQIHMDKFIYFENYISKSTTHRFQLWTTFNMLELPFQIVFTQAKDHTEHQETFMIWGYHSIQKKAYNICIFIFASLSTVFSFKSGKLTVDSTNRKQLEGPGCWCWFNRNNVRAGFSMMLLTFPSCLSPHGDKRAAVNSDILLVFKAESRGGNGRVICQVSSGQ